MTNTAWELWFDDLFIVERIKQQEKYLLELELRRLRGMDEIRYRQLRDGALFIKYRFEHQFNRPHPIEFDYTNNRTKFIKENVEAI